MTLRKTTDDNSVKYIPQSEQTQERESEPKTIKNTPLPKKNKIEIFQKTIKNSLTIT